MSKLDQIKKKMQEASLSPLCIAAFERSYSLLLEGSDGKIPESEISPVDSLSDSESLENCLEAGQAALSQTVKIKLNGGLGTSMGLDRAKSLLPAKKGQSFLDIISKQVVYLREQHKSGLPLIFMNSFRTEADTLEALKGNSELLAGQSEIPLSFVQNKVPKILADDLAPASWKEDSELEWCPPGHGDIYTALLQSGILDSLLSSGYRYAFVSNADNLGASLDLSILGHFAKSGAAMLMEVADRTQADKKGGHLARDKSGKLILREVAQCPEGDINSFQDISKHKYFNTNSLWFDLQGLKSVLDNEQGVIPLPLIVNKKNLDPVDTSSPKVFQLETAMGTAISVFDNAEACLLYTSPSPRDATLSRMPSSA